MSSPIAGVTLEQYATLCAAMANTGGDEAKELALAAEAGVSAEAWQQAKDGFTARMQDPADMGKTAMAFMPLYQAAQSAARGGGPPCSIELYTEIATSYSYEQDAQGEQVPPALIYQRHGITAAQWSEYTGYWTPRVNDPADAAANEFRVLTQAASDRIFGIHRDANGSRVDIDDEDASPADRAAARAALANARRPVDGNPNAVSPGAGPVPNHAPSEPPRAVPPPVPAAPRPAVTPSPSPGLSAAPSLSASPTPPEPSLDTDPTVMIRRTTPTEGHTEEERMFAAMCHAAVCVGFAGFAPAIIWFMHKDGKSEWVASRAKQAMIAQFVGMAAFIVVSMLTCGIGALLIFPWMAAELFLAWKVWQDEAIDYPLLGDVKG